jgi:fibronectin-binding autotransporter adhesin
MGSKYNNWQLVKHTGIKIMAILNFPTTRPNGSPLQPGDQYAGDNGVNYTVDGVRWLGRTPSLGYTGSTGTQGLQGITGYTGSIGRRWELTSGTTTVSLDSIGTLTFPTGSLIRNGYPGPAGGSGDSSSWFVASTAGGGVASADGKQYVQVDNVGLFMGTNFTTSTGYEWVFGNDGNLTFPNGGKINTTGISGEIDLVAGSALAAASLGSYDLKNYTWVDNSGAYVYTNNANQWKFGLDGVLKFPDTTVQSTAWNPNKDIIFTGNVTFANTTTYSQSTNTVYTDNILEIHAPTGGVDGKWTVNDGKDIGLRFHYYNGTDTNAALYMDNGTWRLKYTIDAVESNGQFSHSGLGDIEARTFYGNVVSTGTVTATNFVGNLTGIATTASYATSFNTGTLVRNAVTASIVTLAAQPNITSVGTLTNLQVGGNTNIGGVVNITNTTSATPSSSFTNTGALQVAGATWLGYGTGSGTGNPVIVGPGLINGEPYAALGWDYSTGSTNGAITSWYFTALSRASIVGWAFENSFGLTGDPTKSLKLQNAAASTSTTTGALQVAGGVGVGGNMYVGGTTSSFIGNVGIGTVSPTWKVDVNLGTIDGTSTSTGGYNITGDAGSSAGYTTYNMQLNNSRANASGYMRLARTAGTAYLGMQIASQSRDGIAFLTGETTLTDQVRISATGTVTISTTTNATSTTTGALQVVGGVGIGKNLYVGGAFTSTGVIVGNSGATFNGVVSIPSSYLSVGNSGLYTTKLVVGNSSPNGGLLVNNSVNTGIDIGAATIGGITDTGTNTATVYFNIFRESSINSAVAISTFSNLATVYIKNSPQINTSSVTVLNSWGLYSGGAVGIFNTASSVSTTTGALQVVGGVGIGGNLNVGGVITATNIYVNGYAVSTSTGVVAASTTGTTTTFVISNTTISTGTTTGALQVVGGVGVGGNLNVGGTIAATTASIGTIVITSSTIYSTNTTTDINFGLMGAMANINMNRKTIFAKDISVASTASVANLAIQNTTITASTDTVGTWVLDSTLQNITNPTEIFFNTTGSVMYVTYSNSINQYPLPTPWDVTSNITSSTLSLAAVDTGVAGLFISPDGVNMIICGNTGVVNTPNGAAVANEDRAYTFTLSVPGDITTAVLTTSTLFTTATGAPAALTSPQGIHFSNDGLIMYVADSTTDYVNQFALSTPYVVNPATYTKRFSIVNEEAGVTSLRFNAAGTRMYIQGTSFKEVNEYRLATPWDIATAVWYDHYFPNYAETSPTGMFISEANNYAYLAGQAADTVVRYRTDRQAIQVAPDTTASNIILPGSTRIKNAPLYIDGYLQVRGSTTVNALTVNGTLASAGSTQAVTLTGSASSSAISMYNSISTGAITFATAQTTGALTIGGTAQTAAITIGQSTVAQTLNFGTGATAAGSIKVINIGTLGASGSTSTINIGSTVTGATGILTINSTQTIITSTTTAVSTTTGALRVAGGVGVGGALYVNSVINSPNIAVSGSFSSVDWGNTGTGFVALASTYTNLTNTSTIVNSSIHAFGIPTIASTTATTVTNAATVYIAGTPLAGTNTTITNAYALRIGAGTSLFGGQVQAQSFVIQSTTGITAQSGTTTIPIVNTVATTVNFAGSATTITVGATNGTTTFASVTTSSSTTTGALTVVGGVGIGGNLNVGGTVAALASPGTTATTASAVGYLGMPQTSTATSYTLIASDQGKHIYITASGQTITIPSNVAVPYPIGSSIAFIAGPSATTVSIAITTDTMYLGGSGTTGTRTLAAYGMATAVKVATTTWFINGTGLT